MAEKFAARNLSVVLNLPEEAAVIHVDGRRMWRVLENIFGNAAKICNAGDESLCRSFGIGVGS